MYYKNYLDKWFFKTIISSNNNNNYIYIYIWYILVSTKYLIYKTLFAVLFIGSLHIASYKMNYNL